jgi:hypothetical protein
MNPDGGFDADDSEAGDPYTAFMIDSTCEALKRSTALNEPSQ